MKLFSTISTRILLAVLLTVMTVLGLSSIIELNVLKQRETKRLIEKGIFTVDRIANNLAYPLWNLNHDGTERVLLDELNNPEVNRLRVFNEHDELFAGKIKNSAGVPQNIDSVTGNVSINNDDSLFSFTREIIFKNTIIGTVKLDIGSITLKAVINELYNRIMIRLALSIVILSLVLFISLRLVVIQPITKLKAWAKTIPVEPISTPPQFRHSIELNSLAETFGEMSNRLRENNDELEREHKVLQDLNKRMQSEIQERIIAEDALRNSELRFRTLVENAPEAIVVLNVEKGVFEDVNENACRFFKLTREELLTKSPIELSPPFQPDGKPSGTSALANISEAILGKILRFEWIHIDSEGTEIPCEIHLTRLPSAKKILIRGSIIDISERKKAEEALQKSEAHYRALVENTPDIIAGFDRDMHYLFINSSISQVSNISPKEFIGKSMSDVGFTKEQAFEREKIIRNVFESCLPAESEFEFQRESGKDIFDWRVYPVVNAEGAVLSVFSISRNITERKLSDAALQISEERFRSAMYHSPIGKGIVSPDGSWLDVNPALCEIVGYSREELLHTTFQKITHPEDLEADLAYVQDMLARKIESYQMEKRYIHKNGNPVWIQLNVSLVWSTDNTPQYFIAQIQDIHERKQADEKIKESEERYRDVVESARDAIFSLSNSGKILSLNQAFESMLGWSREDWIGKPFSGIIHPEDLPKANEAFQSVIQGKQGPISELRVKMKSGEFIIGEFISTPQVKNGKVVSILGIARDITKRKKLEEQILRTQRLESLGTLSSGIAHDLNNVLTPILLSIDILQKRMQQPDLEKIVTSLRKSASRGSDIVKQILSFARGSNREPAPQQLRYVIDEIKAIINQTFSKNIVLQTNISRDIHLVLGDATQLHQVIMNLCVNARDAMPLGGVISITASNITLDGSDFLINAPAGDYIVLAISDTGTGIPKEIQDRIFEPFFTTKEVGKGTGLGLSTVYTIVNEHHGFIKLYSEVGKGTEFKIYFPALMPLTGSQDDIQHKVVSMGNGELILVVDDEPSILHITKETLEAYNYRVLTASDGAQAFEIFSSYDPGTIDLVISDTDMPRLNGPDAIRAIRKFDPAVKVIMTSGMFGIVHSDRIIELNLQGHLTKPFTTHDLLEKLEGVLKG